MRYMSATIEPSKLDQQPPHLLHMDTLWWFEAHWEIRDTFGGSWSLNVIRGTYCCPLPRIELHHPPCYGTVVRGPNPLSGGSCHLSGQINFGQELHHSMAHFWVQLGKKGNSTLAQWCQCGLVPLRHQGGVPRLPPWDATWSPIYLWSSSSKHSRGLHVETTLQAAMGGKNYP